MCGNGFSELCYDVVICQISSLLQETTFASLLLPSCFFCVVLGRLFVDVPFGPFMRVYVEIYIYTHAQMYLYIFPLRISLDLGVPPQT